MRICVYCGSKNGRNPEYLTAAKDMGATLARAGFGLVYGGARIGLMGSLADAALAAGGEVIGVMPAALAGVEVVHRGLSELRIVESMHERKAEMAQLAAGFIALPGGLGTFEELFEIWTWAQLQHHAKPFGLLNTAGYYDPLLNFLDQAVSEGFIAPQARQRPLVATTVSALLQGLQSRLER